MLAHPDIVRPEDHAVFTPAGMGKSTLFASPRVLVGVNAFEPGQSHALHAHAGMDKVYHVISGEGEFLLEGGARPMRAGDLLVAPADIPHGVRNTGGDRLIVLVVLAPGPAGAGH
jgi:quercetin dioxygenase-like cupin family protein